MPSDTYILTISESGVSVPSSHASTHISGGSDVIPTATSTASGLMSAAIFTQHGINTAKVSNATHTGDVSDAAGVLTVKKINGVLMESLATGIVKNTTGTGAPSIAIAADFPTLNQSTTGNANTATTATNIAGGSAGSVPYQTASGVTAMLAAGTVGHVLKSNGSGPPSWGPISLDIGSLVGSLPVSAGGTGASTFTAGVLKANGVNSFTTVQAPNGELVGTTDSQILTNKTFGIGTTFSSAISVANGGTGATSFNSGVLTANGTNAFSVIARPSGDLVGTTATQTLTNKTLTAGLISSSTISSSTISSPTISNPTISDPTISNPTISNPTISGGTISSLATPLPAASGGTGFTSYAIGDLLLASTSSTLSKLSSVSTGNALISNGAGSAPSYGKIGLSTHVSGTLPVASGGTGATTLTGYVKGTGTTAMTTSATIPVDDISGTLPVAKGGTGTTTSTGAGANVFSSGPTITSPVLVSPSLGTPISGSLINCTGLPLDTGTTGILPITKGGIENIDSYWNNLPYYSGISYPVSYSPPSLANPDGVFQSDLLSVSWGGTGLTTTTARAILIGGSSSSGPLSQMTTGTSGQLLISQGSAANPTWLSSGTTGQVLTSAGSGANPTWTTITTPTRSYAVLALQVGVTTQTTTTTLAQITGTNGSLDSTVSSGFTGTGYTLTYTGTTTALFKIDARFDITTAAANDVIIIRLAKGTTTIANSESRNFTGGALGGADNSHLCPISTSYIVSLATNETVTVFIAHGGTGTINTLVRRFEMIATQV